MAKVKFTNTHDRVAVVATFADGDKFTLSYTRTGHRANIKSPAGSNRIVTQAQIAKITAIVKRGPKETVMDTATRVQALCETAKSFAELTA